MFILYSIDSSLEFWSVNLTWLYKNSESEGFKKIKVLVEISNNWTNNLLAINIYKPLKFCW